MNPSTATPSSTAPVDEDLAEQARPGHGVPSQDPDPAAQLPLYPEEADREAKSVLMGGGMVAGAATGATLGVAVGGPVGVLLGGALGAVAGALGGAAAGSIVNLQDATSANPGHADSVRLHIKDSGGSGRAQESVATADAMARGAEGVVSVQNDIKVKKDD